jgi:hypothetical protein
MRGPSHALSGSRYFKKSSLIKKLGKEGVGDGYGRSDPFVQLVV